MSSQGGGRRPGSVRVVGGWLQVCGVRVRIMGQVEGVVVRVNVKLDLGWTVMAKVGVAGGKCAEA